MTAIGDIYLIHHCADCRTQHEEYLLPLDEGCHAVGVALGNVWVYEHALEATRCRLLVMAEVDGRPYAIALARTEGNAYVQGWIECLDTHPGGQLTPAQAYDLAAGGAPLPVRRSEDANELVLDALRRSANDRDLVNRILKGVDLG